MIPTWRQGSKVKQNVYEGDRPVCQTHNDLDAATMTLAVNYVRVSFDILRAIEWSGAIDGFPACPYCGSPNLEESGHAKDCKLDAMIAVANTFVKRS